MLVSSLREEYSDLYTAVDAYHCSPQTLEKRKYRGKIICAGAHEMCRFILDKIFLCSNIDDLRTLLGPLRCLFTLCTTFPKDVTNGKLRKKIVLQSIHEPDHLRAIAVDCFHFLIQLRLFTNMLGQSIDEIEEDSVMIEGNRLSLLISRYLQDFVVKHPAFHAQVEPYQPRSRKRSVWSY